METENRHQHTVPDQYVKWLGKCSVALICVDGSTLGRTQDDIALDIVYVSKS